MADIKRLNYFIGQFLDVKDFQDEQQYLVDMRRRQNTMLYRPGILDGGFIITKSGDQKITVGAGVAVDRDGKELILLSPIELELPPGNNRQQFVTITHQESLLEEDTRAEGDYKGSIRITERPGLRLSATAPTGDRLGRDIVIGLVMVDNAGTISGIDTSVRQYAQGRFQGGLTVAGNVGIGSPQPGAKLTVQTPGDFSGDTFRVETKLDPTKYSLNLRAVTEPNIVRWVFDQTNADNSFPQVLAFDRGSVGIGTTTPGKPLVIRAARQGEELIGFEAPDGQLKWHINQNLGGLKRGLNFSETGVADGRLFIQAATGNVGIGTDSPSMSLQVNTSSLWGRPAIGGTFSNKWAYLHVDDQHSIIWNSGAAMRFGVETEMGAGYAERMRITSDGNVGIGTSNPLAPLQIGGGVDAPVRNTGLYIANPDGSAQLDMRDSASDIEFQVFTHAPQYGGFSGHVFLGTFTSHRLVLRTNDLDRMTITETGNVGIGTLEPTNKLHVVADGGFDAETNDGVSRQGHVPIVAQSDSTAIGILNRDGREAFAINIDNNLGRKDARGVPTFYDRYDGISRPCLSLKNGTVGIEGTLRVGSSDTTFSSIQAGTASSETPDRQEVKTTTVRFSRAFTGIPKIIATAREHYDILPRQRRSWIFKVSVMEVSAESCTIYIAGDSLNVGLGNDSPSRVHVDWLAWV